VSERAALRAPGGRREQTVVADRDIVHDAGRDLE
jgi:hypothetical protein